MVTGVAESVEDMVGLPEGELGASAADADWVARIIVLGAHGLYLGYGMRRLMVQARYTCAVSGLSGFSFG